MLSSRTRSGDGRAHLGVSTAHGPRPTRQPKLQLSQVRPDCDWDRTPQQSIAALLARLPPQRISNHNKLIPERPCPKFKSHKEPLRYGLKPCKHGKRHGRASQNTGQGYTSAEERNEAVFKPFTRGACDSPQHEPPVDAGTRQQSIRSDAPEAPGSLHVIGLDALDVMRLRGTEGCHEVVQLTPECLRNRHGGRHLRHLVARATTAAAASLSRFLVTRRAETDRLD